MSFPKLIRAADLVGKGVHPRRVATECGLTVREVDELCLRHRTLLAPRGRTITIIVPGIAVDALRRDARKRGIRFSEIVAEILCEAAGAA